MYWAILSALNTVSATDRRLYIVFIMQQCTIQQAYNINRSMPGTFINLCILIL